MLLIRRKSKPPELSVDRLEESSVMHCVVWVNMIRTRQSQSRIMLCVWVEERLEKTRKCERTAFWDGVMRDTHTAPGNFKRSLRKREDVERVSSRSHSDEGVYFFSLSRWPRG